MPMFFQTLDQALMVSVMNMADTTLNGTKHNLNKLFNEINTMLVAALMQIKGTNSAWVTWERLFN